MASFHKVGQANNFDTLVSLFQILLDGAKIREEEEHIVVWYNDKFDYLIEVQLNILKKNSIYMNMLIVIYIYITRYQNVLN